MIRTLLIYIILSAVMITSGWAQTNFSPLTRQLVSEIDQVQQKYGNLNYFNRSDLASARASNEPTTGALAMVTSDINETELNQLGVKIRTRAGNIWTMDIPLKYLTNMSKIKGLVYLEVDHAIEPRLEESRKLSKVNEVHQALEGISKSYTGEGVVVGIIDYDFVLNHPSFYDESGENYRISRIWEQNLDGNGPEPYGYGVEVIGQEDILGTGLYSTSEGSHGTHVAGIAGGSGNGNEGKYRGYAPDVELVFVELGGFATDPESGASGPSMVIDAVDYIFKYAASQNKPAVINMSLGTHVGPHDGTSLLEQGLDGLADDGKVLVAAAGNEGGTSLHVSHTFDGEEVMATTITGSESSGFFSSDISVWGSVGADFEVNMVTYDASTGEIDSTGFISTSAAANGAIGTEEALNSGEIQFATSIVTGQSALNNRPNAYIRTGFTEEFNNSDWVILMVRSSEGVVHIWDNGSGNGAELSDAASMDVDESLGLNWKNGDTHYTVGEFGTANEVITVGSYNTIYGPDFSDSDTDPDGQISSFSSLGPTLDQRVKPDIVAPGNRIISSLNAEDPELDQDNVVTTINANDNQAYVFGFQQGTSMAAPAVAGAVALMLQAKPDLDHADILAIFGETAAEDNFVSLETVDAAGSAKSNTWGYGKIDVLAAMIYIEENLDVSIDLPNLKITDFSAVNQDGESVIVTGDEVSLVVTIENNGNAATAAAFNIEFDFGDFQFSWDMEDAIAAGSSITETVPVESPADPGQLSITTTIDSENVIVESDETDNTLSSVVTILAESVELPNLTISDFSIVNQEGETTLTVGDQVFFNVSIENMGTAPTTSGFEISYDVDGELFTTTVTEIIEAGGSFLEQAEVESPSAPGELTVIATLDTNNDIEETNENDNDASVTVSIQESDQPDPLAVDFAVVATTIVENESISFDPSVTGGVPPYSYNWTFDGGNPSNSSEEQPTILYGAEGTFDVLLEVTDDAGTSATSSKTGFIIVEAEEIETGIIDPATSVLLNVYPNPTVNQYFTIEMDASVSQNQIQSLRLISLNGQSIPLMTSRHEGNWIVSTEGIPTGMYVLLYQIKDKFGSRKLFIN